MLLGPSSVTRAYTGRCLGLWSCTYYFANLSL